MTRGFGDSTRIESVSAVKNVARGDLLFDPFFSLLRKRIDAEN